MRGAVARYKNVFGAIVAAVILAAIFVPFQKAEAFTVTLSLPGTTGNQVTQSTLGSDFSISVQVFAGEFIPISSIDVILDNTVAGVERTTFTASGSTATRSSGSSSIIKDNVLTISPVGTQTAYGYGFGTIGSGLNFNGLYSYSIASPATGFLAGNNAGLNNPVTTPKVGVVGPGTITLSGKLNTFVLAAGAHTLDVVINTGAGGNGVDKLTAPQLALTVIANPSVVQQQVNAGATSTNVFVPGVTTPITLNWIGFTQGGTISASQLSFETIDAIFTAIGSSSSMAVGANNANTAGVLMDIDLSALGLPPGAEITITIPYNPALLPPGFNEANVKFFHHNGNAWEDVTVSVNTTAKTVTGKLTSLSPVVAGYVSVAPGGGGAVGGGGAATTGGGGTGVDLTPTYPDSYFTANPLAKVQVQSSKFVGANGQTLLAARPGMQLDIQTSFKNYQQGSQAYAIIVQVIDSEGFTADVGWVTGTLAPGETTNAARSWVAGEPGNYTVRIFVWDGISQSPTALSIVNDKTLSVVS